ncbi:ACT domain-containing protein [Alteromonas sp. 5E99-2]|uniref:ACT domain-containing protein n=1 Tax=Alteromonas sp. 5E99-2 TaxID=2817683 RepID=UPI00325A6BD1
MSGDYVFCCVQSGSNLDVSSLSLLATFNEVERLTLILRKETAVANNLTFESVFKGITLTVHSSLDVVGLTAAVASKLASKGISANVIAAYYHDHIFV